MDTNINPFIDCNLIPLEDRASTEASKGAYDCLQQLQTAYQETLAAKTNLEEALAAYKTAKGICNVNNNHPEYLQREHSLSLSKTYLSLALRNLFYSVRKLYASLERRNIWALENFFQFPDDIRHLLEFVGKNNVFIANQLANEASALYYQIHLELPTLQIFLNTDFIDQARFTSPNSEPQREYVVVKMERKDKPGGGYDFVPKYLEGDPNKIPAPPYMTAAEARREAEHLDRNNSNYGCMTMMGPPSYFHSAINALTGKELVSHEG